MTMKQRAAVAILIALTPVLIVAGIALATGYTDPSEAAWAVVCTALLLGFAAYRRRRFIAGGQHG